MLNIKRWYELWSFVGAETPVPLELPNQWLWDIIDEFIYQVIKSNSVYSNLILYIKYIQTLTDNLYHSLIKYSNAILSISIYSFV